MRLADYVASLLASHGIRHVFLVTGGNTMHLNDAFGRSQDLECLCCHHEQACTMAAESYFRLTHTLAVANVTSGPGATNAITGVYGAWVDSLGMVVISGQPKWETLTASTNLPLRQLGDQETDIVRMVRPITKYAVMVTDPSTIRYHLERAVHLAKTGRPGPCWIDIPMNVQGAEIEPDQLRGYDPSEDVLEFETPDVPDACREILRRLSSARRPVILPGTGVRISGEYQTFMRLIEKLNIPVAPAWNAQDLIWNDHPCFVGRPGTIGDRSGNFAVQNADVLLVLGCRLNIRQVSYHWKSFARDAFTIMVDIDAAELKKPTVSPDFPIHADLGTVLPILLSQEYQRPDCHDAWLSWCQERRKKYPVVLPEYRRTAPPINPYHFMEKLFAHLPENEIIVAGDGSACVMSFQAAFLRQGQRLYTNSGCASMGYDLPAAIGACLASGRKRIVCLAGDGSIMMNVQELQTIAGNQLPIKIFVLRNGGYLSVKLTQRNFFPDNIFGCSPGTGVTFPDFQLLAQAHGIPCMSCSSPSQMDAVLDGILDQPGPSVCEVLLDPEQGFSPKSSSKRFPDGRIVSAPLEDLAPFLSREELLSNMLIPLENN